MNPRRSNAISNYHWTPPVLRVRSGAFSGISSANNGPVGDFIADAVCLGYELAPLPEGGTARVRIPGEYAIRSDVGLDARTDYRGHWWTIEKRSSNRRGGQALMRGRLASQEMSASSSTNGVNRVVSEGISFRDAPIRIGRTGTVDVGTVCQWYTNGAWSEFTGSRFRAVAFPKHPMIRTDSGKVLSEIDEFLMASTVRPGALDWSGRPFADSFAELIRSAYGNKWLPMIRYDGNKTILTAYEKGRRKKTLVCGQVGVSTPATDLMANVLSIDGSEDYQTLYNQVIGIGAQSRRYGNEILTPAWSSAEEAAVLADPSLSGTRAYEHVGRAFLISQSSLIMDPGTLTGGRGTPRFWKSDDDGTTWYDDGEQPDILVTRRDGSTAFLGIDRAAYIHPKHGDQTLVWFKGPQLYRHPTTGAESFKSVKTNVVYLDGELQVLSDMTGDFPFHRLRLHVDQSRVYEVSGDYYTNEAGTLTSTKTGRDDRAGFKQKLDRELATASKPANIKTITLWYYDEDWFPGDEIDTFVDTGGEDMVDLSGSTWYVERVLHDTQNWRTTLMVSGVEQDLENVVLAL